MSKKGTLIAPQMKSFGPKFFQIQCTDQKVPFWQFFRQGRDGRPLLVRPSRIPDRISKILFALGANEFLAMLEGKIRETPFLKVHSGKLTVWQEIVLEKMHIFSYSQEYQRLGLRNLHFQATK